jgi:hypothetical protein
VEGNAAPWISGPVAVGAKLAIALATNAWIGIDIRLREAGRAAFARRGRDALLAALGIAGGLGWFWFGAVPLASDVHEHDTFHYYLGAKYFRELGYTHLYLCALGADLEAGLDPGPRVRDLATNELVSTFGQLDAARACKSRFTTERWTAFRADLDWFRARLSPQAWHQIREDHGFNGSPVWLIGGALLARAPGGAAALPWLVHVDLALLFAMWAGVVTAFGWRTAAVAAVFWGTNGVEGYDWTGATLLRQDWLAAFVLGIACLRRARPAAAGALLATAAWLRLFPAIAVAALVAKRGIDAWRARSLAPLRGLARFAVGAALATALLVPLATGVGGATAWRDFAANSEKLLATPLFNHMGLRPLVAFEPGATARRLEARDAAEPNARWKASQREHYAARRAWLVAIAALYLVLLARALPAQSDWSAVALGTGAIPVLTQLTGYYHVVLIGLALLHARWPWVGAAMALLAAATQAIYALLPYSDVPFLGMSAVELLTILAITAALGGSRAGSAETSRGDVDFRS